MLLKVDFWFISEIYIFFTPTVFLLQIITILLQFSHYYFSQIPKILQREEKKILCEIFF